MKMEEQQIGPANVWHKAGKALGVEIVAPYCFEVNGDVYNCLAYVPHFGGMRGTLVEAVCGPDYQPDARFVATAQQLGYFVSSVNAEAYSTYNKRLFVDTLEDWVYFGPPSQAPRWLQGRRDGQATEGPRTRR